MKGTLDLKAIKMAPHALVHVVAIFVLSLDRLFRCQDVLARIPSGQVSLQKFSKAIRERNGAILPILRHISPVVGDVQESGTQVKPIDSGFRDFVPPKTSIKPAKESKFQIPVTVGCV